MFWTAFIVPELLRLQTIDWLDFGEQGYDRCNMSHSLIVTLRSLTGNPRGCVYTEPLWGIPYNLFAPYASVYMVALGLSDKDIGIVLSVSWGFQVLWALLSGAHHRQSGPPLDDVDL